MNSLIQKTHEHVSQLLEEKLAPEIVYHNLLHTKRVFKSTKEILEHSSVSEKDAEALQLASLLHDVGYISQWDGHEEISAEMAQEFLKGEGADQELIDKVVKCILATKMEHEPQDELEYIIRDADASHFAKDYYLQASEYLREELKNLGIHDYSLRKWTLINIDLFSNKHQWYTDYAKEQWEPQKKLNLKMLKEESSAQKEKKKKAKLAKLKAKLKDESPEKAIQSMYRVTLRNHIKLSDIADTKANILLSVNAIIISLALSNLIPKLDNPSNAYLIVPTVVFVIFSVAAMILSVLATRPNVTRGKFTREDVEQKRVNLLFFGNFHKMEYQEFDWAINQMLNDKDYIYSAMTKDLYFLGIVLDRKYKILRLTYTVFIVGIIISVIAFAIAFQWSAGIREAMGA